MPVVSVIMPARNAARTIVAGCQSILQQSFKDLELIVVDDASSDATRDCLENLQDARLRVVKNTGDPGISGALNTGLAAARGRLLPAWMRMICATGSVSSGRWITWPVIRRWTSAVQHCACQTAVYGAIRRVMLKSRRDCCSTVRCLMLLS